MNIYSESKNVHNYLQCFKEMKKDNWLEIWKYNPGKANDFLFFLSEGSKSTVETQFNGPYYNEFGI